MSSPGANVHFWENPERSGWLQKQGAWLSTWRRRWFVIKEQHIFWFKSDTVTQASKPRGVIQISRCLSVKGAEETKNIPNSFEVSVDHKSQFFVADTNQEKEDWINAIGRCIVQQSSSMQEEEVLSY
mmetsp:Transcript_34686/g.65294  ORF Transcript_34686/g.65294 Transcript_34686/m.65294 type:complete len:127 (+) Transcript_34686:148-528(+)